MSVKLPDVLKYYIANDDKFLTDDEVGSEFGLSGKSMSANRANINVRYDYHFEVKTYRYGTRLKCRYQIKRGKGDNYCTDKQHPALKEAKLRKAMSNSTAKLVESNVDLLVRLNNAGYWSYADIGINLSCRSGYTAGGNLTCALKRLGLNVHAIGMQGDRKYRIISDKSAKEADLTTEAADKVDHSVARKLWRQALFGGSIINGNLAV